MKTSAQKTVILSLTLAALAAGAFAQESLPRGRALIVRANGEGQRQFVVHLERGEFVDIDVAQRGSDVVLTLTGPEKQELALSDFFTEGFGRETVCAEGEKAGDYVLHLESKALRAGAVYEILAHVGAVTERDRDKHLAEQLLAEAELTYASNDGSILRKAVEKQKRSLELWQKMKDDYWQSYALNAIGRFLAKLRENNEAATYYEKALALRRKIGDPALIEGVLINLSSIKYSLGDYKHSLAYSQLALAENARSGILSFRASSLLDLGRNSSNLGQFQKAIAYYQQARLAYERAGKPESAGIAVNNIGLVYTKQKAYDKAPAYFNEALGIMQKGGFADSAAMVLGNIAWSYQSAKNYKDAERYYLLALAARRSTHNRSAEAGVLKDLGDLYREKLRQAETASEWYRQELSVYTSIPDLAGEASAHTSLSLALDDQKQYPAAIESYKKALALYHDVHQPDNESLSWRNIGVAFENQGLYPKAEDAYEQSINVSREARDRQGEAKAARFLADLYEKENEFQKAIDLYSSALQTSIDAGDEDGQADALYNRGFRYYFLSQYDLAIEDLSKALEIYRRVNDQEGQDTATSSLSDAYYYLGDYDKALEFAEADLGIATRLDDESSIATTLNSIAGIHRSLGNFDKSADFATRALALSRKINDRSIEAAALLNLGRLAYRKDDTEKAMELMQRSLAIARDESDTGSQSDVLSALADVAHKRGDYHAQLQYVIDALLIDLGNRDPQVEAEDLRDAAEVYDALNKPLFYTTVAKLSINLFQQVRGQMRRLDNETQKRFLKSNDDNYYTLASVLMKAGRLSEAQQVINAFKDQEYFDFDRKGRELQPLKLDLTARESAFAAEYQTLSRRVRDTGQALDDLRHSLEEVEPNAEESAKLSQLQADAKAAADDLRKLFTRAETDFDTPGGDADIVKETRDTAELKKTLGDMDRATGKKNVAVYTLVFTQNFRALIVTPDGIKAVANHVAGSDVNQTALKLWAVLQSDRYNPLPLSQKLYSMVAKPIADAIPTDTDTILWSLDGNLRYVPMAALHDGSRYMVERYNNVLFTRADRERLMRPVTPWTGIGFGTSEAHTVRLQNENIVFDGLPGVKRELDTVFRQNGSVGVLDGPALSDAEFNKAKMIEELAKQRPVVHIASHFSFRAGDETRSFLLLGDGKPFTLSEMKQTPGMFDGVELLTLSACNTGAQQSAANGREIDGFAELAQRLGAASVMATLWSVADNSTPWLMRDFYAEKLNRGATKAEAVRQAQLELLTGHADATRTGTRGRPVVRIILTRGNSRAQRRHRRGAEIVYVEQQLAPRYDPTGKPAFAHPYYWAPFVLFGNWR